jgi:WD40 repeat protein
MRTLVWITVAVVVPAEDRPGESGLTFKLKQRALTPGLQKSPDGKLTVQYDGLKAYVVETDNGKAVSAPLELMSLRKDSRITAFAFSPDGKLVAVGTGDPRGKAMGDSAGEVRVWEVATGRLVASINPTKGDIGYVRALAFSGDGKTVLVNCLELSGK